MFKQGSKKANVDPRIHFHSLRHSFASNLAQKGVSLYIIKELLGHASISTTEIYSHLNMESLREAVDKLGQNGEGAEARGERHGEVETRHFDKSQCRERRAEAGENNGKDI